jgi:hypothetical protein
VPDVTRGLVRVAATFAFVLLPSLGVLQKNFGTRAAVAYAVAGIVASAAYRDRSLRRSMNAVDPQWSKAAALLGLTAAVAVFVVVYPMANAGEWSSGVGGGSDRDEALQVGGEALLAGEYPYYQRTFLNNPISPMPGSILAALPFAAMGQAALQNLFWLPVFWLTVGRPFGNPAIATLIVFTLFGACPGVAHDFLTGGDLASNSIMVLVAALWLLVEFDGPAPAWRVAVAAAVMGVTLSSRASFWLMLPVLHATLTRRGGLARATGTLAVAAVTCAAVTLPFYLYDPSAFTPFTTQNKFVVFTARLPLLPMMGPLACMAFSVALAWLARSRDVAGWLMVSAAAMLLPSVMMVLLASARDDLLNLYFTTYGLPSTIFGGLGVALWSLDSHRSLGTGPSAGVARSGHSSRP